MIAKIGDIVECDFGVGKLVACTKQWAIIRQDNGEEIGLYLKDPDQRIWFPAETSGDITDCESVEVKE